MEHTNSNKQNFCTFSDKNQKQLLILSIAIFAFWLIYICCAGLYFSFLNILSVAINLSVIILRIYTAKHANKIELNLLLLPLYAIIPQIIINILSYLSTPIGASYLPTFIVSYIPSILTNVLVGLALAKRSDALKIFAIIIEIFSSILTLISWLAVFATTGAQYYGLSSIACQIFSFFHSFCLDAYWIICIHGIASYEGEETFVKNNVDEINYDALLTKEEEFTVCRYCGNVVKIDAGVCNKCGAILEPIPAQNIPVKTADENNELDFMKLNEFVIDEAVSAFKFTDSYKIYDMSGKLVGAVEQEGVSSSAKASQIMLGNAGKGLHSFKLNLLSASGEKLGSVNREGWALGEITIKDKDDQILTTIKRGFNTIKDLNGSLICKFGIAGLTRISIKDANGNAIGEIEHKWNGAKSIFTSADKYHITLSKNLTGSARQIICSIALAYDLLYSD